MLKNYFTVILGAAVLMAAGPTTQPTPSLESVEDTYHQQVDASKRVYNQSLAKAKEDRLRGLRVVLAQARTN